MLAEAQMLGVPDRSGAEAFLGTEAYHRGFSRCLALRSDADAGQKYSAQFQNAPRAYFDSFGLLNHPRFAEWWADHLGSRVADAFNSFIPWCQNLSVNFAGARVLEVGCGTGSSTVALAAHADFVLACDIHLPSINAARIRLTEDGFAHKVKFLHIQSGWSELVTRDEKFDIVVLYSVVEHMLPSERDKLFSNVWNLLRHNGKLVLYETPNRLWPKDQHTTGLVGWSWFRKI